jgi:hypothetical protein
LAGNDLIRLMLSFTSSSTVMFGLSVDIAGGLCVCANFGSDLLKGSH